MLDILERNKNELASDYAKRILRHNIVSLKLEPGQQLNEAELIAEIGVSRTPIREAILDLKRIGVVDVYPQSGTFVSLLDFHLAEDIRYMRYLLESDLAAQACRVNAPDILMKMYENVQLQKLYSTRDPGKFFELDNAFHHLLYVMCGKEGLYSIIEDSSIRFDRVRVLSYTLDYAQELVEEHKALVQAIEARDSKTAARVMKKHLTRAIKDNDTLMKKYPQYYKK